MVTLKKIFRAMSEVDCPVPSDDMAEMWLWRREDGIKYGYTDWRENALADILLVLFGDDNAVSYCGPTFCYFTARIMDIDHIFKDALDKVEELRRQEEFYKV